MHRWRLFILLMMNRFFILFFCILLTNKAFAQKDSLAFDDHGKYIYYKVVEVTGHQADSLYNRGVLFVKNHDKKNLKMLTADEKNAAVTGNGIFLVYGSALGNHPAGQISYQLKAEFKNDKYRYWLTDFVYTPYFRDRYNNYVPQREVAVALEKSEKYLSVKELNSFAAQTAVYAKELGVRLKQYLLAVPTVKTEPEKKVIHIDKW